MANPIEVYQCANCEFPHCEDTCPTEAFTVREKPPWRAKFSSELCFSCGQCVRLISPDAPHLCSGIHVTEDHLERVAGWIERGRSFAVILGPGLESCADWVNLAQICTAWRILGAEVVIRAIDFAGQVRGEIVKEVKARLKKGEAFVIDSRCGAIRNLVRISYPNLSDRLVRTDSTLFAASREAQSLASAGCPVVFLGPCIAYKRVVDDEQSQSVQAVLTWPEFETICDRKGIILSKLQESEFDDTGRQCRNAPIAGDIAAELRGANIPTKVCGEYTPQQMVSYFDAINLKELPQEPSGFISPFLCGDCYRGPGIYAAWRSCKREDAFTWIRKEIPAYVPAERRDGFHEDLAVLEEVDGTARYPILCKRFIADLANYATLGNLIWQVVQRLVPPLLR